MYNLNEITLEHFKKHTNDCANGKHTSIAPLGMSGENIYLHKVDRRTQEVSLRLYCGTPELLITNNSKDFLFYGRLDVRLGLEFLATQYFNIFELVKSQIPLDSSEPIEWLGFSTTSHFIGFAMMEAFKKARRCSMIDYSTHPEHTRHGGAYDRGKADRYYGRTARPHCFSGATYHSEKLQGDTITAEQTAAYMQGYTDETDEKDWGRYKPTRDEEDEA